MNYTRYELNKITECLLLQPEVYVVTLRIVTNEVNVFINPATLEINDYKVLGFLTETNYLGLDFTEFKLILNKEPELFSHLNTITNLQLLVLWVDNKTC